MKSLSKWICGLILIQLFVFKPTFGDEPLYKDESGQYHYNFDDGDEHYPYWKINGPAFLNKESFNNKHYLGSFQIIKKASQKRAFVIQGCDAYGGCALFYLRIPQTWKVAKSYTQTEKFSSLPRFQVLNSEYLMVYVTDNFWKYTDKNGKFQRLKVLDLCFVENSFGVISSQTLAH